MQIEYSTDSDGKLIMKFELIQTDGDSHCLLKGTYDIYDALDGTFQYPKL